VCVCVRERGKDGGRGRERVGQGRGRERVGQGRGRERVRQGRGGGRGEGDKEKKKD
jgi:hypothetical protein